MSRRITCIASSKHGLTLRTGKIRQHVIPDHTIPTRSRIETSPTAIHQPRASHTSETRRIVDEILITLDAVCGVVAVGAAFHCCLAEYAGFCC